MHRREARIAKCVSLFFVREMSASKKLLIKLQDYMQQQNTIKLSNLMNSGSNIVNTAFVQVGNKNMRTL